MPIHHPALRKIGSCTLGWARVFADLLHHFGLAGDPEFDDARAVPTCASAHEAERARPAHRKRTDKCRRCCNLAKVRDCALAITRRHCAATGTFPARHVPTMCLREAWSVAVCAE